jgi:hypothetical protein
MLHESSLARPPEHRKKKSIFSINVITFTEMPGVVGG